MNNNEMEFEYLNDAEQPKKDRSKIIYTLLIIANVIAYILYGFIYALCFLVKAIATIFLLSSFKSKKKRKKRWF